MRLRRGTSSGWVADAISSRLLVGAGVSPDLAGAPTDTRKFYHADPTRAGRAGLVANMSL